MRIDEQLQSLITLRHGTVQTLETLGYAVENASRLSQEIDELQKLKKKIFESWPWSSDAPPPVDRNMVAESRAAIARGDKGEHIEDLIHRLQGSAATGS